MIGRARANVASLLIVSVSLLVLPALASAGSGGAGVQGSNTPPSKPGKVEPGNVPVVASANGITIVSEASGFLGSSLHFSGNFPALDAGSVVEIERRGHQTNWSWSPTAHARVARNGSFSVLWHVNHIGRFSFRAVLVRLHAPRTAGGAPGGRTSPSVTVTVYKSSIATYYGPGFWGSMTACGDILRRNTFGVANRTLPCGTEVAIYYQGRTIMVPVIDRGPYANGADWDLTQATANALGMGGIATIWAVSLPRNG